MARAPAPPYTPKKKPDLLRNASCAAIHITGARATRSGSRADRAYMEKTPAFLSAP